MPAVLIHPSHPKRASALVVAIATTLWLAPSAAFAQQPAPANRIAVQAIGLRNTNGHLRCALYDSAPEFATDKTTADAAVPIKDSEAACNFDNIAPGTYAIALLHDENDNEKMDYTFFGLPKEGYGFSNDAKPGYLPPSAPSFDAAKFEFAGGIKVVPIHMQYW